MPDDVNPTIKRAFRKAYNIEFIEFPHGRYDELSSGLTDLADEVGTYRETNPI
jgi:hypothetical protein